jgi:hypothetical protein
MSEDLGRLTDGDLGHLTDEDFERIGAIVEGSVDLDRAHGQHILDAVEASAKSAGKPHLLVEAMARAYRAREGEQE